MLPLLDDEESLIARLEARVGQLSQVLNGMRDRCERLDQEARSARAERDTAAAVADGLRAEVKKAQEEMTAMRSKQQEAAARVRSLLEQIDRLGLFDRPQER